MTDQLRISAVYNSGVNLLDDTKFQFVEMDEPSPVIDRKTQGGCGPGSTKLVKRSLTSWEIPITIYCRGSDGATRFQNRDAVIAELEAAISYELNETDAVHWDGMPHYLVRTVDNQSPSDIWQIIDYDFNHQAKRNDNKHVTISVKLICWPGQKFPANADLTGVTVTNVIGGIGRAVLDGNGWPSTIGTL